MSEKIKPFKIVSPGEIITSMLDYMGWSQSDLSEITGLTPKTISLLAADKQNISMDTAVRLGSAFGKTPEFWINLFAKWQLAKSEKENVPVEVLTATKARLHKFMPVAEIKKKGWFLGNVKTLDEIRRECTRLYGQEDIPEELYEKEPLGMAARQTREDSSFTKYYKNTWFCFAKLYARTVETTAPYDRAALEKIAVNLPRYTLMPDGAEKVISDLKKAGVSFFVLSHLSKTYLDGAAFLENGKPFVVYTGRYNREDNFWFVLAHEISHVLLHYDYLQTPFLDTLEDSSKDSLNEREKEADKMAGVYLNNDKILRFAGQINRYVTEERLVRISRASGVSVPVALGVMQHAGIVSWKNFSKYKPKILDKIPGGYIKG